MDGSANLATTHQAGKPDCGPVQKPVSSLDYRGRPIDISRLFSRHVAADRVR
jgi:hypothetical protein